MRHLKPVAEKRKADELHGADDSFFLQRFRADSCGRLDLDDGTHGKFIAGRSFARGPDARFRDLCAENWRRRGATGDRIKGRLGLETGGMRYAPYAPSRNPELDCALGSFWLLRGGPSQFKTVRCAETHRIAVWSGEKLIGFVTIPDAVTPPKGFFCVDCGAFAALRWDGKPLGNVGSRIAAWSIVFAAARDARMLLSAEAMETPIAAFSGTARLDEIEARDAEEADNVDPKDKEDGDADDAAQEGERIGERHPPKEEPSDPRAVVGITGPRWMRGAKFELDFLKHDEEPDFVRRALAGDESAAARIVGSNYRRVRKIIKDHIGFYPQIDKEELIHEGQVELQNSLKTFDPTLGGIFPHAEQFVLAAIRRRLRGLKSVVEMSDYERKMHSKLSKERAKLAQRDHEDALLRGTRELFDKEVEEIAHALGIRKETVRALNRLQTGGVALGEEGQEDDEGNFRATKAETIAHEYWEAGPDPGPPAGGLDDIRALVSALPPVERRIVESRWMLDPPISVDALAIELGISVKAVNQTEARALARLRGNAREKASAEPLKVAA